MCSCAAWTAEDCGLPECLAQLESTCQDQGDGTAAWSEPAAPGGGSLQWPAAPYTRPGL